MSGTDVAVDGASEFVGVEYAGLQPSRSQAFLEQCLMDRSAAHYGHGDRSVYWAAKGSNTLPARGEPADLECAEYLSDDFFNEYSGFSSTATSDTTSGPSSSDSALRCPFEDSSAHRVHRYNALPAGYGDRSSLLFCNEDSLDSAYTDELTESSLYPAQYRQDPDFAAAASGDPTFEDGHVAEGIVVAQAVTADVHDESTVSQSLASKHRMINDSVQRSKGRAGSSAGGRLRKKLFSDTDEQSGTSADAEVQSITVPSGGVGGAAKQGKRSRPSKSVQKRPASVGVRIETPTMEVAVLPNLPPVAKRMRSESSSNLHAPMPAAMDIIRSRTSSVPACLNVINYRINPPVRSAASSVPGSPVVPSQQQQQQPAHQKASSSVLVVANVHGDPFQSPPRPSAVAGGASMSPSSGAKGDDSAAIMHELYSQPIGVGRIMNVQLPFGKDSLLSQRYRTMILPSGSVSVADVNDGGVTLATPKRLEAVPLSSSSPHVVNAVPASLQTPHCSPATINGGALVTPVRSDSGDCPGEIRSIAANARMMPITPSQGPAIALKVASGTPGGMAMELSPKGWRRTPTPTSQVRAECAGRATPTASADKHCFRIESGRLQSATSTASPGGATHLVPGATSSTATQKSPLPSSGQLTRSMMIRVAKTTDDSSSTGDAAASANRSNAGASGGSSPVSSMTEGVMHVRISRVPHQETLPEYLRMRVNSQEC